MIRQAWKRLVISAIVILLFHGVLHAGVDALRKKIDSQRISLDLKSKPLTKVLQIYSTLLGMEIHVQSCDRQRPVTLAFDNITVRTSLNAISESSGLRWSIEPTDPPALSFECQDLSSSSAKEILRPMKKSGEPDPVGLMIAGLNPEQVSAERLKLIQVSLRNAELKTVLGVVAKLLHAELAMDKRLQEEKVTIARGSLSLSQFMDAVCKQVHAKWKLSENDPRVLIVSKS
jgi:type II secretory pathway component GspD/PulD (secretin)